MGKTAREWFSELPEPYRSQALAKVRANLTYACLSDALYVEFDWSGSPQGINYWEELFETIEAGKPIESPTDLATLVREYFTARNASYATLIDGQSWDIDKCHNTEKALREAVGL